MNIGNAVTSGKRVDMYRTVTALSSNVFVQRVPGDTLHIVHMFSKCKHTFAFKKKRKKFHQKHFSTISHYATLTGGSLPYCRGVIGRPGDEILSIWRP